MYIKPVFSFYKGVIDVIWMFLFFTLIIATYTDLKTRIIPNWLVFLIFIVGLITQAMAQRWETALLGFLIGALTLIPFFVDHLGAGDAKLFMALGILMGPVVILLMFTTSFFYSLGCIYLFVKEKGRKMTIPLAPYVLAGYISLGGVVFCLSRNL